MKVTEEQIQAWAGDRSFDRGRQYYRNGSIHRPRRRGNTLMAECFGSMAQPYHVEISLGDRGIVEGECSCPVGDGGHCKHAAALMLTWLHAPEKFTELEALSKSLADRSKEELIAVIERMVERYPDLEDILELPFVASGQAPQGPIDPNLIQRQIENLLVSHADEYGYGYDYNAGRALRQGLKPLIEIGASYLEHGDWQQAAVIYQTIIAELLPQLEMFHEESDDVYVIINDCIGHLGACFAAADPQKPSDAEGRRSILQTFFDVQEFDITHGGIDLGYEAAESVGQFATAEEKALMAEWVKASLPEKEAGWSGEWRRQAYGGWLLELQEEAVDTETYLEICRQTGRTADLVERLLQLGRLKEAIYAAQEANDYLLLQLADRFRFHGHAAVAEDLVWERTASSKDTRLEEWLKQRAIENGDWKQALQISEQLYWQRLSTAHYEEVKALAEKLEQWEQRRALIHKRLAEQKEYIHLTEIHLWEDNVAAALESLQQAEEQKQPFYTRLPRLEVAKAAEATHPADAIRLYVVEAQNRIKARGRGNYEEAAQFLARVKYLYEAKLNARQAWQALIQQIREENRTLRAMKEEFDRAGL
jgi:hypothetical protein